MVRLKDVKKLPKIELHRHIEGAMRPETLREYAAKKELQDYPYTDPGEFKRVVSFEKSHPPDFLYFLSKFINVWYDSLDDVQRVAYECAMDAYNEGIMYFELRFSPEHYAVENDFPRDKVIERLFKGVKKAEKEVKDLKVNFLITLNRMKQKPQEMMYLVDMAKEFNSKGLVGLDLAGDEINYPAKDFTKVYEKAKESGLFGITIHAGEAVGPISMWDSLEYLFADRIGHGVAAIQDEKLMERLRDDKVALEQCFTSNILTGAVKDINKHPFRDLYDFGIPMTICTDDPTVQQSNLNDDYFIASKVFKFGFDDFKQVNLNAIDSAFLSDSEKQKLKKKYIKRFDEVVAEIESE